MQIHPSFIFIRHAQSVHNEKAKIIYSKTPKTIDFKTTPQYKMIALDESLADGSITALGQSQARSAMQHKKLQDVDIVVVSPLRRALETCDAIFGNKLDRVKVFVDPLMTHQLTSAVDIGVKLKQSKEIYGKKFDFSKFPEKDEDTWFLNILSQENKKQILQNSQKNNKSIGSSSIQLLKNGSLQSQAELKKRVDKFKQQLIKYKQKSKNKVALVGHSYIFQLLSATGFYQDMTPINDVAPLDNCEIKQVPILIDGYHEEEEDIVPFCRIR